MPDLVHTQFLCSQSPLVILQVIWQRVVLSHLVHLNTFSLMWVLSWNFTSWGFSCVSSSHLTLRSSCHTFCTLSLSYVVPSCLFNSPDPNELMPDIVHPKFLYCRSPFIILQFTWWRKAIVAFGALECPLSCVSLLMKFMLLQVTCEPTSTLCEQK